MHVPGNQSSVMKRNHAVASIAVGYQPSVLTAFAGAGLLVCIWLAATWQASALLFLAMCAFVEILAFIAAIDASSRVIPNQALVCALGVLGVAVVGEGVFAQGLSASTLLQLAECFAQGLLAASLLLALALVLERCTGRASLGGGDIKLMFVAASYLGCISAFVALGIASVLSLMYAAATRQDTFPFGPFIAIGSWLVLCTAL